MFLILFGNQDKPEKKEGPLTEVKVAAKTQKVLNNVRILILGSLVNPNLHGLFLIGSCCRITAGHYD